MLVNLSDLHSVAESLPIKVNNVAVGTLLAEYEVRARPDLRGLEAHRAYALSVRMRVLLSNPYEFAPGKVEGFYDYPAAFSNTLSVVPGADGAGGVTTYLVDYSPKTINSEINTSRSSSSGTSDGSNIQRSSGSSTSETNSWEVSVGAGMFGWLFTPSISGGGGGSTTYARSDDVSQGTTRSVDAQSSLSMSMSVKDWAVYGQVAPDGLGAKWLWGQEFPWNVLDYFDTSWNNRKPNPNKPIDSNHVNLPAFVKERMWLEDPKNGNHLVPPSQLSLYGVNFCANADWLVRANEKSSVDEVITIRHGLRYFTASHYFQDGTGALIATLSTKPGIFEHTSRELNLPILALDPILGRGIPPAASVGFSPQEFISGGGLGEPFRIVSSGNNLYIAGEGFTRPSSNNDTMLADIGQTGARFEIKFKVVDLDGPLALYIKHWKTTRRGCRLGITINGLGKITRVVDALDAGDGSDNITTVLLLQRSYTTEGYFNYLSLGLNTIVVEVERDVASGSVPPENVCGYALRAIGIG